MESTDDGISIIDSNGSDICMKSEINDHEKRGIIVLRMSMK